MNQKLVHKKTSRVNRGKQPEALTTLISPNIRLLRSGLIGFTISVFLTVLIRLIFLSVLLFSFTQSVHAQSSALPSKNFAFDQEPTRIIIPRAAISLPVKTAKLTFNTWETNDTGASYGEHSALPGATGNTVIFSHALPHLFGNLSKVRQGDLIHVFTKKDWFIYKVTEMRVVPPESTDVIFSGGKPELTLYTCVGSASQNRLIVKALPLVEL